MLSPTLFLYMKGAMNNVVPVGLTDLRTTMELHYIIIFLLTCVALLGGYFKFTASPHLAKRRLPPGSLGFPIIGETVSFLRAHTKDKSNDWMCDRINKYGPVFKTSLAGSKAVVLTGQAANRFIFSGGNNGITANQPVTTARILGKYNILEVTGSRHKLIRSVFSKFLKPESIQRFVGQMDSVVQQQMFQEFRGKDTVKVVPIMKKITFKVTCSLLFGIPESKEKDALLEDFTFALKGLWAVPLNIPGTDFHRALQARGRICKQFSHLIRKKKEEMGKNGEVATGLQENNIIPWFLSVRDENGELLTEEEIIDNLIILVFGSHDTSTVLLCDFIRHLARNPEVYDKVLEEQREVIKAKKLLVSDEKQKQQLTWSEMQMMRYTWRVAQELMRITPPVFGNFRCITRDTTFGGFDIPKGWQVFWVASGTHMDEDIFEEPEKFNPSRFESTTKSFPAYTYVAFGAGHRICPGTEFARIEVLLIIHHLITNYRWTELIPGEPITRQPMPYPAMGLPIKLIPHQN